MNQKPIETNQVFKVRPDNAEETSDILVVEEPLEISLIYHTVSGSLKKNISVTMRTPGNDTELAIGFLFTEGIIKSYEEILEVKEQSSYNKITVTLKENVIPNLQQTDRNFYTSSSCGVCGKTSIEAVNTVSSFSKTEVSCTIPASVLYSLPDALKSAQPLFENTGGIHGCAFFSPQGKLQMIYEDVGRHNALDKLIGAALKSGALPLNNGILLLSGRSSFELMQKALMAGIFIVAAVGAPSSLAVELARENHMTLVGFLRNNRFNVYAEKERILM